MNPLPTPTRRAAESAESGSAMILALFFTILVSGVVLTGTMLQRSYRTKVDTSFRRNSQALQFARAGMTEAVNWFRRQTTQPVTAFEPVLDEQATPPILDTEDPDIGIVRTFRITGKVYGRYEVWKSWDDDPSPERLAWRQTCEVVDVGLDRRTGMEGAAWRITSLGYVYEQNDADVPFNQAPNRVLSQRMLETEILRRRLAPPAQAAVSVERGDGCRVDNYGLVDGGNEGAGVVYPKNTGGPGGSNSRYKGRPKKSRVNSLNLGFRDVFGASYNVLRGSANQIVTDARDFPEEIINNESVVAEVDSLVFDRTRPLRGTGLLVVHGDVEIQDGSNSTFNGLLYVTGDLSIRGPATIEGAVVVLGNFRIGGAGDYATVRYDDAVLNTLRQEVGQYRFLGSYRQLSSTR